MRAIRLLTPALLLSLASLPVTATSYVPVTDEALVDQAPMIAVVVVKGTEPGSEAARPFTLYRMRVEKAVKGGLAAGFDIRVRVPGGTRPSDGMTLQIWGAPRFTPDERALLFLSPRFDGSYEIVDLMLGAFHEVRAGGHHLALRELSEAHPIARPGEPLPREPLRDFDRFVDWVAGRVRGVELRARYTDTGAPDLGQISAPYTLFHDSDGYNLRWFLFDSGGSVEWLAYVAGQDGLPGGGFAEFQAALAAWNNDPATNIAYTYGGTTTDTTGLTEYDELNTIVFNDPNGELPAFSCSSGGVLAYGGPWYQSSTLPYQGTLFHPHVNADIVVNDGLTCFFQASPNASKVAEELFAHELGHTLGLNHSCGDSGGPDPGCGNPTFNEAVMRSYIHDDGRGALLNSDDRAAIAYLYAPALPTDFFTITPCRLIDTRGPDGPYGGPSLSAGQDRTFAVAGQCGIPSTAVSLSVNITVVAPSGSGRVTLFPADRPQPNTSNLNFSSGLTLANNAILLLSGPPDQAFTAAPEVAANGTAHLVIDVNGYFE